MAADRTSALHIRLVCCTKWTLLAPSTSPAAARQAQFPLSKHKSEKGLVYPTVRSSDQREIMSRWLWVSFLRTSVSEFFHSQKPMKWFWLSCRAIYKHGARGARKHKYAGRSAGNVSPSTWGGPMGWKASTFWKKKKSSSLMFSTWSFYGPICNAFTSLLWHIPLIMLQSHSSHHPFKVNAWKISNIQKQQWFITRVFQIWNGCGVSFSNVITYFWKPTWL